MMMMTSEVIVMSDDGDEFVIADNFKRARKKMHSKSACQGAKEAS